jgi:hypothetical protein
MLSRTLLLQLRPIPDTFNTFPMKQFTHAWIAMMAVKRLEKATIPDEEKVYAASLARWFKNHKDDVIAGAWYPDAVIKDMATSHILKLLPDAAADPVKWRKLPETYGLYRTEHQNSLKLISYRVTLGNLPDRCEALTHSIIDNFKMFESELKGSVIMPSEHHIAAIFHMLSHYIADAHMPLHCDARKYSEDKDVHGHIEGDWDERVRKCYKIETDNTRFCYDEEGNPVRIPGRTDPVMDHIENQLAVRPFDSKYGPANKNTWDFMSAVTQYSYLTAYELVPAGFDIDTQGYNDLITMISMPKFEELSKVILMDAIDSVAKVWLRAWKKYKEWGRNNY